MSNLPADPNQVPYRETKRSDPNPRSRWKKATLASLLSFLVPGMGQLFNRQPRKGFTLALITYLFDVLMLKTRLLFIFSTMVTTLLAGVIWRLFVAAEAGYTAAAGKKPESSVPMPRL